MQDKHSFVRMGWRHLVRWRRCRAAYLSVVGTIIVAVGMIATPAVAKKQLTIRDVVETARFMVADTHGTSIAVSPDATRYAAMLIRGDIARDGVEVEIIAGEMSSIDAAKPKSVVRLFTRGLGATTLGKRNAVYLLMPTANFPVWIDNNRVAFLWEDEHEVHQVVAVDVTSRALQFLTDSPTDVTGFTFGANETLVYEVKKDYTLEKSDAMWRDGFTLTNTEAYALLIGAVDGATFRDIALGVGERYVKTGGRPARKLAVENGGENTYAPAYPTVRPKVSPDGRLAIVPGTPEILPEHWGGYEGTFLRSFIEGWDNRRATSARALQQMYVVSVDAASARPLWDAPLNPIHTPTTDLVWSPDSKSVLVWPVYLPLDVPDEAGRSGDAVAEVDVQTGNYVKLPLSKSEALKIAGARWTGPNILEVKIKDKWLGFEKQAGSWMRSDRLQSLEWKPHVLVEVRQDENSPPVLFAADQRTGEESMVFDPNPGLRTELSLGEVKFIQWKDETGYTWEGRLFLPVGYRPGRRYPLVIQTHAWGRRGDFTLGGRGSPTATLGPIPSVYMAQPLANQGIVTLQVGPLPPRERMVDEAKFGMRGYISAIEHLSSIGLVDRTRVGIMGNSRTGWHVEYVLAFSDFPFAAAIVTDNIDSGYFEAGMVGWASPELRNGSVPFGIGLKDWLENSPAFNVEHVKSPLLMMVTDSSAGRSKPVAMGWEMFSRLRYLKKPVEFYIIPNIERGSHMLQNPTQLLAQQERGMDWWLYWLKDERDKSDEKKAGQYVGWDKLRFLRDEDARRAEFPRLHWTVSAQTLCEEPAC